MFDNTISRLAMLRGGRLGGAGVGLVARPRLLLKREGAEVAVGHGAAADETTRCWTRWRGSRGPALATGSAQDRAGGAALSLAGASFGGGALFAQTTWPPELGVQLYTVRRPARAARLATLKAIAATGFNEVETTAPILADGAAAAQEHGLTAPSGHFDTARLLDGDAVGRACTDTSWPQAGEGSG